MEDPPRPGVIARYFQDNGHEDDDLDPGVVSAWLRDTATRQPQGPARPDDMGALRARRDAIAARLTVGG